MALETVCPLAMVIVAAGFVVLIIFSLFRTHYVSACKIDYLTDWNKLFANLRDRYYLAIMQIENSLKFFKAGLFSFLSSRSNKLYCFSLISTVLRNYTLH